MNLSNRTKEFRAPQSRVANRCVEKLIEDSGLDLCLYRRKYIRTFDFRFQGVIDLSLEENVRELLAKEKSDDVVSVATDILRSLVILGGSAWQSDLLDTLAGICTVKGMNASGLVGRHGLISKALKRLNVLDLIHSETRLRSDLGRREPVKEEFHFTDHLQALTRAFVADSFIDKYRREVMGYNTLRF